MTGVLPNIFKCMSAILVPRSGDLPARRTPGHNVIRRHFGDWGTQFGRVSGERGMKRAMYISGNACPLHEHLSSFCGQFTLPGKVGKKMFANPVGIFHQQLS